MGPSSCPGNSRAKTSETAQATPATTPPIAPHWTRTGFDTRAPLVAFLTKNCASQRQRDISLKLRIFFYSPECVEGLFCELRAEGVLGSRYGLRSAAVGVEKARPSGRATWSG